MRWLKIAAAALFIGHSAAYADDSAALKSVLSALNAFSANFSQQVIRHDGSSVMQAQGTIALKRPDSLLLHTKSPDETVLFTRGDAVYYYDPFVNQVSIYSKDQMQDSPFILLTSNSAAAWQQYQVKKDGSSYILKPKRSGGEITGMRLSFDGVMLTAVSLQMKDGNTNTYTLSSQRPQAEDSLFNYQIPADAERDDERGK